MAPARGFIATQLEAWNLRLSIWHFYVDAEYRRRGIGRALMTRALEFGRLLGGRNGLGRNEQLELSGDRRLPATGIFDLRIRHHPVPRHGECGSIRHLPVCVPWPN